MSDRRAGSTGETDDAFRLLWEAVDAKEVDVHATNLNTASWLLVPYLTLGTILLVSPLLVAFGVGPEQLALLVVIAVSGAFVIGWRRHHAGGAWLKPLRANPAAFEALWQQGDLQLEWIGVGRAPSTLPRFVAYPSDWRPWLSGWLDVPLREPATSDPFAHALLWRLHDAGKLTLAPGPAAMPPDLPQDAARLVAALGASPRAFARAFAANAITLSLRWPRDIILRRTERYSGEARWNLIVRRFARQEGFRGTDGSMPHALDDGREMQALAALPSGADPFRVLAEAVLHERVTIEPPQADVRSPWWRSPVRLALVVTLPVVMAWLGDPVGFGGVVLVIGAIIGLPAWQRRAARRRLEARILAAPETIDALWQQGVFQLRWRDVPSGDFGEHPVTRYPTDWRRWIVAQSARGRATVEA